MSGKDFMSRVCAYNKANSDPTRMKILRILGSSEPNTVNVKRLAEILGLSQPTITKHLQILEGVNLLDRERDGSSVYYSLNWEAVDEWRMKGVRAFDLAKTKCPHDYDCKNCPDWENCA